MADLIKTVTDKSQFQFILDNFFTKNPVYIKTSSGNLALQYLGYADGNVAFRVPLVKSLPDNVVVFTRYKTNNIYLSMKPIERNEDTFIFIPIKFQIISESRKEDRKLLGIEGGKSVIYTNNLISDYNIERSLSTTDKKVDKIKEVAEFELKKKFEHVRIVLIHEAKSDIRLKHVISTSLPIFMPNLNVDPEPGEEENYNFYVNTIYKGDISLSSRNRFISEITVPILYNKIIPYGYVQVNGTQPFSDGLFEVCRRMSIVIDQLLNKNKLIQPLEERFLISDLSKNGLGFVFREKRHIRNFQENCKIAFDILLPTQKKAVIGAIVRNISFMENGIIKLGCEIFYMDDTSRANYDEFIDKG
ncbi:MAG TPA: hypothetical protein PLH88_05590 [Spirochaetota bacterium]|nr:hypothetical protein [Spirochaetota bacterium]